MPFIHDTTPGNKKVLPNDVGKPVRACTGQTLGTIGTVARSGEFQVALSEAGRAYLRTDEDSPSDDAPGSYHPEDVEMVTDDAVWLRR